MKKKLLIVFLPIATLSCMQTTSNHKKLTTVHHEADQRFDFERLPLDSKLHIIIGYAHELEKRLPHSQHSNQLSNRQLASNIRIFAQSALKDTPPCEECMKVREQSKRNSRHAQE